MGSSENLQVCWSFSKQSLQALVGSPRILDMSLRSPPGLLFLEKPTCLRRFQARSFSTSFTLRCAERADFLTSGIPAAHVEVSEGAEVGVVAAEEEEMVNVALTVLKHTVAILGRPLALEVSVAQHQSDYQLKPEEWLTLVKVLAVVAGMQVQEQIRFCSLF